MTSTIDGPILSCVIRQESGALHLAYEVKNTGNLDVGLFDQIMSVRLDGVPEFPTRNVYIDWIDQEDRDAGMLHLQKCVLPVPEGLQMAERPVPYVTLLKHDEKVKREFSVPIPIAVCNPLRRAVLSASAQDAEVLPRMKKTVRVVRFSVGAFFSDAQTQFIPISPDYPGVFRVWPPGPPADRQILLTEDTTVDEPLTTLDYQVVPRDGG